jgi:CheY-like chemotaxis protein
VPPTPPPIRVQLVDDHPATLAPLRDPLQRCGYRVESVEGVLYAMWSVNASHRVYDALLCSVELADGDSVELITHLRQRMGVRTIALAHHGCDPRALRRAATCLAIDRVLPHPAGGASTADHACQSICDAVADLMSADQPLQPPPPPTIDPTIHPRHIA